MGERVFTTDYNAESCGLGAITYNGNSRIYRLLKSLSKYTSNFESMSKVVVDDGSPERELKILREICKEFNVPLREHRRNLGIPAGWNHCYEYLKENKCKYGVLLNDDIEVTPRWLDYLMFFAQNNQKVGMISLQQNVGGQGVVVPDGADKNKPFRRIACEGYCFLMELKNWENIGKFDEGYYSFYEEQDAGAKLAKLGYYSYGIPPSVIHEWGETFRQNDETLFPKIRMRLSRELFETNHGGTSEQVEDRIFQASDALSENRFENLYWLDPATNKANSISWDEIKKLTVRMK